MEKNSINKIAVIGAGYVGLSNATLFASINKKVVVIDVDDTKIEKINNGISPIKDNEISQYLEKYKEFISAKKIEKVDFSEIDLSIVCVPTNFVEEKNSFDTEILDNTIEKLIKLNENMKIIIKSTIPIGYTENISKKLGNNNVIFSPEFLREGKALYDNLYPQRIIFGALECNIKEIVELYKKATLKENVPVLFMSSTEAEATKIFSNTYLALRISFFNELDMFAETNKLNTENIINGMSYDDRIGGNYNNPSFGYGGYCLPKDTKQLLSQYDKIPNKIIKAITESNEIRKDYIVNEILKKDVNNIGIYKLSMKNNSDNYRESAILYIIKKLVENGKNILLFDNEVNEIPKDLNIKKYQNIDEFKKDSQIILANRKNKEIEDVINKVYTRDIFNEN